MRYFTFSVALLCSTFAHAAAKTISLKADQLLQVKTALGIATIIQVPDAIQSIVIGDQSAFKIEYLDTAVTIKPLRGGARTNMYLTTAKRRFDFRLVTVSQDSADYILYVQSAADRNSAIWTKTTIVAKGSNGASLSIARIGKTTDGFILIEALAKSNGDRPISPAQVWVKQLGAMKTINSLYLSQTKLAHGDNAVVGISLARSDLVSKQPLIIEIQDLASVEVPEALWR